MTTDKDIEGRPRLEALRAEYDFLYRACEEQAARADAAESEVSRLRGRVEALEGALKEAGLLAAFDGDQEGAGDGG